ncbi:hypothetical protein D4T97_001370 [Siminovitchia acidinfaciens]|uniref:Opine dehydrogenase n=1 Tax=Siminovitchia acidinfaciens TaxID=2321395 RepID=A0A429Y6Z8_9BACI|nr:NAD/NADP-dependent octopine/nopaline dehydrogenase family protein [Siminovitchia acidinfaciens]RST77175.1 hypothetical protein D4T97_001370 [Siminovitchia acidinfaciens]
MTKKSIAVLGAGNGGVTAAADLTLKGFDVRLFELEKFSGNLKKIRKNNGIRFVENGVEKFVSPFSITTDIKEALTGADIIMLVVPAVAIEHFAGVCAPHLEEDQIVFINSAASMGSVRFVNEVRKQGVETEFKICETASLTYGTRATGDYVELYLRVKNLLFSAYPSSDTPELLEVCKEMYPELVQASNVWETTLNNGNPETHPGPSLLNAGRIEYSNGEFYLYTEGITESVTQVIRSVSLERKALCEALDIQYLPPETRLVELGYCEPKSCLAEQYNESKVFSSIKGPLSLSSRYFTEDISMGLVLWSSLGKELNVPTPVIDSIVTLSGALLQTDFWKDGLNYSKLGLSVKEAI